MSFKVNAFRVLIPQPLSSSKFLIVPFAPELIKVGLLVEESTFPTEVTREVDFLGYGGQRIYCSTYSDVEGLWEFTVPDSIITDHRWMILRAKYRYPWKSFNCLLYLGSVVDLFGFGSVTGAIVNVAGAVGAALLSSVLLKKCYIVNVQPAPLDAKNPESVIKWKVQVRYQGIVPAVPMT